MIAVERKPRWLIDDTTGIADARIYVVHTQAPRFIGELLPDDEAALSGITFGCPGGQTLCLIEWIDPPQGFDYTEMSLSLSQAINHHDNIRDNQSS